MGSVRDAILARFAEETGVRPAVGAACKGLQGIQRAAFELIKVCELERSGIRDGNGYWDGSDALLGTFINVVRAWDNYTTSAGADDDDPDAGFPLKRARCCRVNCKPKRKPDSHGTDNRTARD
jgi:hypothetical protein